MRVPEQAGGDIAEEYDDGDEVNQLAPEIREERLRSRDCVRPNVGGEARPLDVASTDGLGATAAAHC